MHASVLGVQGTLRAPGATAGVSADRHNEWQTRSPRLGQNEPEQCNTRNSQCRSHMGWSCVTREKYITGCERGEKVSKLERRNGDKSIASGAAQTANLPGVAWRLKNDGYNALGTKSAHRLGEAFDRPVFRAMGRREQKPNRRGAAPEAVYHPRSPLTLLLSEKQPRMRLFGRDTESFQQSLSVADGVNRLLPQAANLSVIGPRTPAGIPPGAKFRPGKPREQSRAEA
jgi:hypothetical protein